MDEEFWQMRCFTTLRWITLTAWSIDGRSWWRHRYNVVLAWGRVTRADCLCFFGLFSKALLFQHVVDTFLAQRLLGFLQSWVVGLVVVVVVVDFVTDLTMLPLWNLDK